MKIRRILLKIPMNWMSLRFKPRQTYWLKIHRQGPEALSIQELSTISAILYIYSFFSSFVVSQCRSQLTGWRLPLYYWLFFQLRASNRPLPPRWANYRYRQRGLKTATVTWLKQRSMSAVRMLSPSILTAGRWSAEGKIQLFEWRIYVTWLSKAKLTDLVWIMQAKDHSKVERQESLCWHWKRRLQTAL